VGLEDRRYPLDTLIFDLANLFSGERFAGTNPRILGRLSAVCEKAFHRFSIDGYLVNGIPPQYGYGAAEVVKARVEGERLRVLAEAQETAGRGDIDRLMTEWRSLLRQIAAAAPIVFHGEKADAPGLFLAERWDTLRAMARSYINDLRIESLPELPPLSPEQRRPINHRFLRASTARGGTGIPAQDSIRR
jgi:hypothetical protein